MLRHRVTIQRSTPLLNTFNEAVDRWADLATVWAEVSGVSGREPYDRQLRFAESTHQVRIRYRADLAPTDRLLLADGTALDIEAVTDLDGRRRELLLMAKAVR